STFYKRHTQSILHLIIILPEISGQAVCVKITIIACPEYRGMFHPFILIFLWSGGIVCEK
ncbi:MAG: hypothetical protein ABFS35_02945, partial [Bacteroidota bacterium]